MARQKKCADSSLTKCDSGPIATTEEAAQAAAPAIPPQDADKVHQVFLWVIQGATEHQVKQAIADQWPDIDAMPLITQVIEDLKKQGELDVLSVKGWVFEASRELYRKMVDIGDFAGALRAVKQIHDLTKG